MDTAASMVSYEGSCHCGGISYTMQLSSPIQDREVHTCNCSICSINGYILVYTTESNLTFQNRDAVKEYRFGSRNYPHAFCPNCGTSLYARADGGEHSGTVAINGRTLKNVDISTLKISQVDGKNAKPDGKVVLPID